MIRLGTPKLFIRNSDWLGYFRYEWRRRSRRRIASADAASQYGHVGRPAAQQLGQQFSHAFGQPPQSGKKKTKITFCFCFFCLIFWGVLVGHRCPPTHFRRSLFLFFQPEFLMIRFVVWLICVGLWASGIRLKNTSATLAIVWSILRQPIPTKIVVVYPLTVVKSRETL